LCFTIAFWNFDSVVSAPTTLVSFRDEALRAPLGRITRRLSMSEH
jgi:hypothetical protein